MRFMPTTPLYDAANTSANDLRERLTTALQNKYGTTPMLVEDFDEAAGIVVYGLTEGFFQADFSMDEAGNVTLGEGQPVVRRTVYEPVTARAGNREVMLTNAVEVEVEPCRMRRVGNALQVSDSEQERRCSDMKEEVAAKLRPFRPIATQRENEPRFAPTVPYWKA